MDMDEEITSEVVNTDLKTSGNQKIGSGLPGPGRPKGLPNRFTQVKNELLEAFREADGKKRFLELLRGSKTDYKWAVERIISIMPKEQLLEIDDHSGPKVVICIVDKNTGEIKPLNEVNNPPLSI